MRQKTCCGTFCHCCIEKKEAGNDNLERLLLPVPEAAMIQLAVMVLLTKGNGSSRGVGTGGARAAYQQAFYAPLSTATTGARAQEDSLQCVAQKFKAHEQLKSCCFV